ncbi:MAG: nitrite reductase large subunit NirB [Planctomycetales bacterium]|nr:nitrite reductase large subunit NirB [Planctomycetales bacterium]
MVGHRFCEKMVEFDAAKQFRIVTFCEEPRAAYDRVGLTSFFAHRDAEKLMIARLDWYRDNRIDIHIGDRASAIDRKNQIVTSERGTTIEYDHVVMATGSYPFVPPVEGINQTGVFVYRTIEDLQRIIEYAKHSKTCAVIGGGLLGLEAAKAAFDLGLETHVIEFAPKLMPRQIDEAGSAVLVKKIESLGVKVHLNKATERVTGDGRVTGMRFTDGEQLDVDMIIVSAGIRPRDDLARETGLELGQRGGIEVNSRLETSDRNIYAIGECANHKGMVYGLIAPGWEMAEIAAAQICGEDRKFDGTDLSTKLKLMGVDVASFGDYELSELTSTHLVHNDPFEGVYKKLLFSKDGTKLFGGILVGDAADYGMLSVLAKSDEKLPMKPAELLGMGGSLQLGVGDMGDSAQVCSCNNVTKGDICNAIRDKELTTPGQIKSCTKAGTGCGGCMPLVTDILHAELKSAGIEVTNHLCEHIPYSRTELFAIVKAKQLRSFREIIDDCGQGNGCENCKPAVASILATLYNDHIMNPEHQTLQDTNDRFLANTQRDGSFSVIPRVAGGEITPDKLIVLGETARDYGLYTKITGGQRVDLFGAQLQDLPNIWERLVDAGFESGHAYGKALRTVKSCVGSTWCRYGVQDSVGFAIQIENRYKGLRAPHKLKSAVSGCVRECAEAQSKDFGLVATDNGYNLYLCGNGGANPRHGDLVATDISPELAITYIDRFLMYYCMTADKLTRTSVWVEKLEGGIDHVKEVIIDDKLDICSELEAMMQYVVDTYRCEWKETINDPEKRKWFRQFVNTDETEPVIEIVSERGQTRPGNWPSEAVSIEQIRMLDGRTLGEHEAEQLKSTEWIRVGMVEDFPIDGGATIKYGKVQIAVFNFASRGEWYACQQMCPHKKAFVLSRGILGDSESEPKVACPLHKKNFSLETGNCISGDDYSVRVFPVKVEDGFVFLDLPPTPVLDKLLATEIGCKLATACTADPVQVGEEVQA